MDKLLFTTIIIFSYIHCQAIAASNDLPTPPQLTKAIDNSFPDATILTHSDACKGNSDITQTGLLLQTKDALYPLHAVIAVQLKNEWSLNDISTTIDYHGIHYSDFLSDYWTGSRYQGSFEITCTDPTLDNYISEKANGVFTDKNHRNVPEKYLCFSVSKVDNDWVCYRPDPKTLKPVLSFVQFNAD